MRKIESQMCAAIQSNIDWKSGNTEVTIDKETNTSSVYLHGNLIATVTDNDMTIYDGGWQSNTTKSRLNALCDEFCIAGEGIFQKNFQWFVRQFVGKINGQSVFKNVEFDSGFIFAWGVIIPLFFITFIILIMRIALTAIIVLLGANLVIDLMDSNLKTIIEERNETINRMIESWPKLTSNFWIGCWLLLMNN